MLVYQRVYIYIYIHIITLASLHYPMRHENQWSLLRGTHRARIANRMEDVVRFHLGTVFFCGEVKIIYGTYQDFMGNYRDFMGKYGEFMGKYWDFMGFNGK